MDTLREFMNLGWVGSVIGLIGLVVSLILYKSSRVRMRPVFQHCALRLAGFDEQAMPSEIELRYRGEKIDRLTNAYLVVWNSGKETLRGEDIVEDDPLRCEVSENARILDIQVVKSSRNSNKFAVVLDQSKRHVAMIKFSYLEPQDGAVIEVLHTADHRVPKLAGEMKGVPQGIADWGRVPPARRSFLRLAMVNLAATALVGLTFAAVDGLRRQSGFHGLFGGKQDAALASLPAVLFVGVVYVGLPLLAPWLSRGRMPKALNIPALEELETAPGSKTKSSSRTATSS